MLVVSRLTSLHRSTLARMVAEGRIRINVRNSSSSGGGGPSTFAEEAAKFMAKHSQRGSPQSPYMLGTTYKIQMTSLLSITHRITGLGMGLMLFGFGIAELACPKKNFSQLLTGYVEALPSWLWATIKLACGSAMAYHTFNGVRHLCWDMGYGFSLQKLYLTGYTVVGLTVLCTLIMLVRMQSS